MDARESSEHLMRGYGLPSILRQSILHFQAIACSPSREWVSRIDKLFLELEPHLLHHPPRADIQSHGGGNNLGDTQLAEAFLDQGDRSPSTANPRVQVAFFRRYPSSVSSGFSSNGRKWNHPMKSPVDFSIAPQNPNSSNPL